MNIRYVEFDNLSTKGCFSFQLEQSGGQEGRGQGKTNATFSEDQFLVVGVEDIKLNLNETNNSGRSENAGWVTFDDSPTSQPQMEMKASPMVEIGYEDLFKQTPDESYLIVSPDHDFFTVTDSNSVLEKKDIGTPSGSAGNLDSSLLRDTLSSMSLETRTLFTKPMKEQDQSPTEQCSTTEYSTNPFRPSVQDAAEKKRRRPPPRPPPPSISQSSARKSPNVSLPPRNAHSSKPTVPKNRPNMTSTAFSELKASTAVLNQKNSNQSHPSNDPFAELLKETRNGLTQNLNKN